MRRYTVRVGAALCALLILLLSATALLVAQEAKPPAAPNKPAAAKPAADSKRLTVKTDHAVSKKVGKIRETTLTNAQVLQEDSTFAARTIVMESEGDVHSFTCTGNPVYTDKESRITSDKVIGHSSPRWAEFTGNVKMVTTPKKKENAGDLQGKVGGEPTTVTSNTLSYDYGKKVALAKGNVVVVQKNRTLWAEEGTYEQQAELITLRGNVRMKNAGDEELKEMKNADRVTVSLENDWIDIVAAPNDLVEFTLDVKEEADAPKPADNGKR